MDPIADDGWAWSEFGADTFIVLDRTGDLIGEIAYYDEPPNVRARRHTSARGGKLERDRLAGTQFQGGSFVQVIGEQRLFPVDSRWQGAMSSALSRHRHLHSIPLTVSPGAQMEWVLGKARQMGLSPEGAIWGWHGPSVSLCGKAAVRSRGRPEIEAAEVQRRADAVLAEQVNAVRRELSVRVTRPTRYRLTRERQTTRVEAWREMVFPDGLDANRIRSGLARAGVSEYAGPEIRDSNTIQLLFASVPPAERIDRLRKSLQTKASAGAAG